MPDRSNIEWTDATWNPVRGCSRITTGCGGPNHEGGCYAEKIAARFSDPGQPFHGFAERTPHGGRWTGKLALIEDQLTLPLRWRKPRRIFVNSMSDLFHENLSDADIDRVFAVMALSPDHTFQVLTKRAERMRAWFAGNEDEGDAFTRIISEAPKMMEDGDRWWSFLNERGWPLPNVWLGVSAERQEEADERIPHLLNTPAAVRFVSVEPLLAPVDLTQICLLKMQPGSIRAGIHINALKGKYQESGLVYTGDWDISGPPPPDSERRRLDWIIVGGESGPRARPMHPQWARDIRDQCAKAGVPFFFKQWGEWLPWLHYTDELAERDSEPYSKFDTRIWLVDKGQWSDGYDADFHGPGAAGPHEMDEIMGRVGKKSAGRLLDGREHSEFPVTEGSVTQSGSAGHESQRSLAT